MHQGYQPNVHVTAAGKPTLSKQIDDGFIRSFRKVIEGPPHLEVDLPKLNTEGEK